MASTSFPVRERGLKQILLIAVDQRDIVVPRAGTWIETLRGLPAVPFLRVVPRAGTWIETISECSLPTLFRVVPRAGTWIETRQL